ncbi:hypothetical protein HMSSN036_39180 [Paenibacillus macerans]|nr:hypothetical protein HMSSN036_39180 [Paenibacillus macerans]
MLFGEHGKGIWILGDSATRIKRDGEVVKAFTIDYDLAQKSIEEIQNFDPKMTIIACTGEAAYVESTIKDELFSVVKGSYEKSGQN